MARPMTRGLAHVGVRGGTAHPARPARATVRPRPAPAPHPPGPPGRVAQRPGGQRVQRGRAARPPPRPGTRPPGPAGGVGDRLARRGGGRAAAGAPRPSATATRTLAREDTGRQATSRQPRSARPDRGPLPAGPAVRVAEGGRERGSPHRPAAAGHRRHHGPDHRVRAPAAAVAPASSRRCAGSTPASSRSPVTAACRTRPRASSAAPPGPAQSRSGTIGRVTTAAGAPSGPGGRVGLQLGHDGLASASWSSSRIRGDRVPAGLAAGRLGAAPDGRSAGPSVAWMTTGPAPGIARELRVELGHRHQVRGDRALDELGPAGAVRRRVGGRTRPRRPGLAGRSGRGTAPPAFRPDQRGPGGQLGAVPDERDLGAAHELVRGARAHLLDLAGHPLERLQRDAQLGRRLGRRHVVVHKPAQLVLDLGLRRSVRVAQRPVDELVRRGQLLLGQDRSRRGGRQAAREPGGVRAGPGRRRRTRRSCSCAVRRPGRPPRTGQAPWSGRCSSTQTPEEEWPPHSPISEMCISTSCVR